jgi:hypothetical protein
MGQMHQHLLTMFSFRYANGFKFAKGLAAGSGMAGARYFISLTNHTGCMVAVQDWLSNTIRYVP